MAKKLVVKKTAKKKVIKKKPKQVRPALKLKRKIQKRADEKRAEAAQGKRYNRRGKVVEIKKLKPSEVAYTIKDKNFGELQVRKSANAWWMEKGKVEALMKIWKFDAPVEECCLYAGISDNQYRYFLEQHPEFSLIKELFKEWPVLKARETAVTKLSDSYSNAMDYLERKKKHEFSKRIEHTGADGAPLHAITDEERAKIDELFKRNTKKDN